MESITSLCGVASSPTNLHGTRLGVLTFPPSPGSGAKTVETGWFQGTLHLPRPSLRSLFTSHPPLRRSFGSDLSTSVRTHVVSSKSSVAQVLQRKPPLETDPIKLWERFVNWLYEAKELGISVDISRIGFTEEFVSAMEPKFEKAFRAMAEMEGGQCVSRDERRMVGHFWLHNPEIAPIAVVQAQIVVVLTNVQKFAADVLVGNIKPPDGTADRFTQILSVGVHGSALGLQFVAEAVAPDNPLLPIRFIDNSDPAAIDSRIAQIGNELSSTLVLVLSKSGATPDSRNALLELQRVFRERGLHFSKQSKGKTKVCRTFAESSSRRASLDN